MSETKELVYYYDRSRVTTDWRCQRARYHGYEFEGKGVTSSGLALELYMGSAIHDGLSAIAHGVDIDAVASAAQQQVFQALMGDSNGEDETYTFAMEQSSLVEGLLRGFYKAVWPRLLTTYPQILAVEQEMLYEHNNLSFMSKPDIVMQTADGDTVAYIEYKSTASKREDWINSWDTAVQLHSTIRAVEATIGTKVDVVVVQGLFKGFRSYGRQNSVMCYGYFRSGNPPFSYPETRYEYASGFKRVPTWEMAGGVKKWVEDMPENILADQFPQTPPIFIKDDLIDAFFAQRAVREHEIKLANQMLAATDDVEIFTAILNTTYPQKFSECVPGWGKPCSFRQLCHGGGDHPLNHGYTWREPHHTPEAEQWATLAAEAEANAKDEATKGQEWVPNGN